MILVAPSGDAPGDFEEAVLFAGQLRVYGVEAYVANFSCEEAPWPAYQYAGARYLCDPEQDFVSHLIVLGAQSLADEQLNRMRRIKLDEGAKVHAMGRFETRQGEISAASKISYATNIAPDVINLNDIADDQIGQRTCPGFGVACAPKANARVGDIRPPVVLIAPLLGDREDFGALQALFGSRRFRAIVATSGKRKDAWIKAYRPGSEIYQYSEMSPAALVGAANIVVIQDFEPKNSWAICAINNALVGDQIVIDATPDQELSSIYSGVLAGPGDLAQLGAFIDTIVLPNAAGLAAEKAQDRRRMSVSLAQFAPMLGLEPKAATSRKPSAKTWFLPTNGVGLGHARRCSLIARELPKKTNPNFAVFPSCIGMVRQDGFDALPLIQRSHLHQDSFANDLYNYTRLDGAISFGDRVVFDGGYIFDSVMRTILENHLDAVWIRRGLWQQGQDNRVALDREKIFSRIVVPCEALEPLNRAVSAGPRVHEIGPVVEVFDDPKLRTKIRERLAKRYERDFKTLSLTLLGGGIAADLTAHMQAAAANFERRPDHLNLIVVWPGAKVNPVVYGWKNSKVVATGNAALLAYASDMVVSAAGYNGFHEALYNKVPAIFVPQMASYMDDQQARAEEAASIGLAYHAPADQPQTTSRTIDRFLDRGKIDDVAAALAAADLPEPGTAAAARLIEGADL